MNVENRQVSASTPDIAEKPLKDAKPYQATEAHDPNLQYRSVNRAAVGSVVLFLLGLTGLMFWQLLILPLAGILLGYSAYRTIKRYPDEYSGLNLARVGMVVCVLLLVGGASYHAFVYATEVPEGYQRVSFSELQPEGFIPSLPKRAINLRGEPIFIKGYVHPGVSGMNRVSQFVLVPDMGTCCFGGQPKPTDMILVHTTPDSRVTYSTRMVRLAGKFDIGEEPQEFAGVKDVFYQLEADYSK
jgi:hypothetical protein